MFKGPPLWIRQMITDLEARQSCTPHTPVPCSCVFWGSADSLCLCESPRYLSSFTTLSHSLSLTLLSLSLCELDLKENITWHLCQSHDPNVCSLTKHLGMGQSPKQLIICSIKPSILGIDHFDPYPPKPAAYKAVFKFLTAANGVQGHRSPSASHMLARSKINTS